MTPYATQHAENLRQFAESRSPLLKRLRKRNRFFHSQVNRLVAAQVHQESRVIDIGCSNGELLKSLEPLEAAVGIDIDKYAIEEASARVSNAEFLAEPVEDVRVSPLENPDYILMSMVLDQVYDVAAVLQIAHKWSTNQTRAIIVTYSRLWRPLLRLAEILRLKAENPHESYVPQAEVENLLETCGFEITKRLEGVLLPLNVPLISRLLNRWIAPLPIIRHFCLVHVTVARALDKQRPKGESVSIVIAARNEEGHINELIQRIPQLAPRQEIIFVEGGSSDNTWEKIQDEVTERKGNENCSVLAIQQPGQGKGDAVRAGFSIATGEILLILDADISVPPEELPKFVDALRDNKCEFANGSRLVYSMEDKAMRFLNILGNKFFGHLFSYLLGQPVRDTLCGTKVFWRHDYERLALARESFGELDPFGDFDLLFGASAQSLRIRDIPIHYKERQYGTTNISRFRHGLLLLRMSRLAASKLKFVG